MPALSPFERAVKHAGNLTRLAKKLGRKQSTVWYWKEKGCVPADICPDIERVTHGEITRYELRPDVFGTRPATKVCE